MRQFAFIFSILLSLVMAVRPTTLYFSPNLPSTGAKDFDSCGQSKTAPCSCEDFVLLVSRHLTNSRYGFCSRDPVVAIHFLPGECRIRLPDFKSWPFIQMTGLWSPLAFIRKMTSCTSIHLTATSSKAEADRSIIVPVVGTGKNGMPARLPSDPSKKIRGEAALHWVLFSFGIRVAVVENLSFKASLESFFSYLFANEGGKLIVRNCRFFNLGPTIGGILAKPGSSQRVGKLIVSGCEFYSRYQSEAVENSMASGINVWFSVSAEVHNCSFWLDCDSRGQHSAQLDYQWKKTSTEKSA